MTTEQKIEALTKEFNEKIEALKKEVSPVKFEVGKWYFNSGYYGDFIIRFVERKGNLLYGPWVRINGDESCWKEHANTNITSSLRLATKEEIESALIKEAEKRGFKEGAMFKCLEYGKIRPYKSYHENKWGTGKVTRLAYIESDDSLYCTDGLTTCDDKFCSNPSIYNQGQWAEIIKEQPIMIGSYEVKFNSDSVTVGCQTVSKETIKKILEKLDEE